MTDVTRVFEAIDSLGKYAAMAPQDPGPKTETMDNPFIEHVSVYDRLNGGDHWVFTFANGFGASVIRSGMSYGADQGLYELAVLGEDGHLTYDTPITDDVLGHLDVAEVRTALLAVAELS